MQYYWRTRSRVPVSLTYLPWGVAAAEKEAGDAPVADRESEAWEAWQVRAHRLFWLRLNLGFAYQVAGRLRIAEEHYAMCLELARRAGSLRNEGAALSVQGQIALKRGRLDEAVDYFGQSLLIRREVQDRQGEGVDLYELALIAEAQDELDRAETLHRESLAIGVEVLAGKDIADSYLYLGEFLITKRGKRDEGCSMLAEAARLYDAMGVPGAERARETARRLGCGE